MALLDRLARSRPDCGVLALTGDCVSMSCGQLPEAWNRWPQAFKLSVPGNHDAPATFDLLADWKHKTPWQCKVADLLFVGVDSSLRNPLESLVGRDAGDAQGVVLLSHERPSPDRGDCADTLRSFVGSRRLLILHGHDHRSAREWDASGLLDTTPYLRSKIISSGVPRGQGHLITWSKGSFACEIVSSA